MSESMYSDDVLSAEISKLSHNPQVSAGGAVAILHASRDMATALNMPLSLAVDVLIAVYRNPNTKAGQPYGFAFGQRIKGTDAINTIAAKFKGAEQQALNTIAGRGLLLDRAWQEIVNEFFERTGISKASAWVYEKLFSKGGAK